MFSLMLTWRRGRERCSRASRYLGAAERLLESLIGEPPPRVPGTAVFLSATPGATPHALLHNLKHNKVLHERKVFLNVEIHDRRGSTGSGASAANLGNGCWRMFARYGFMQRPDIVDALELAAATGCVRADGRVVFSLARDRRTRAGARGWRYGATACSPRWPATRAAPATTSTSPPTASSSWVRGSRSRPSGAGTRRCPSRRSARRGAARTCRRRRRRRESSAASGRASDERSSAASTRRSPSQNASGS